MPPKKRSRHALPVVPTIATSMADVSKVQLGLREWLQSVHSLRHNEASSDQPESETGVKGHPSLKPGTFRYIAQQAWQNPPRLFKASLELLQKCGVMVTVEDLGQLFMKLKDIPSGSMMIITDADYSMRT